MYCVRRTRHVVPLSQNPVCIVQRVHKWQRVKVGRLLYTESLPIALSFTCPSEFTYVLFMNMQDTRLLCSDIRNIHTSFMILFSEDLMVKLR